MSSRKSYDNCYRANRIFGKKYCDELSDFERGGHQANLVSLKMRFFYYLFWKTLGLTG